MASPGRTSGILPDYLLERAATDGLIRAERPIPKGNFQPASVDLRLGIEAFPLQCSFLPHTTTVEQKLRQLVIADPVNITNGGVLLANQPYLVPLQESLALDGDTRARANPKSTTGRLDIFTRVVTDRSHVFDDVVAEYRGPLYLEVVPQTFSVKVKSGMSLNQLRVIRGQESRLTPDELAEVAIKERLWYEATGALTQGAANLSDALYLSVNLTGASGEFVAYRARKNRRPIDLDLIAHYHYSEFWDGVPSEPSLRLILDENEFYILLSSERVRVPPDFAAEMIAYDPSSGELRTHYAGFFDPGFGYGFRGNVEGSRAVLEVRARDVPFMLEHGQRVCKLEFHSMLRRPRRTYGRKIGSSYQAQGLRLSKHFVQDEPLHRPLNL